MREEYKRKWKEARPYKDSCQALVSYSIGLNENTDGISKQLLIQVWFQKTVNSSLMKKEINEPFFSESEHWYSFQI